MQLHKITHESKCSTSNEHALFAQTSIWWLLFGPFQIDMVTFNKNVAAVQQRRGVVKKGKHTVSQFIRISSWQVCWEWWPTWCSPRPSSSLSAWAQRTGNPKRGTTAGPICEFPGSYCTYAQIYQVYPDTRFPLWASSPSSFCPLIRTVAYI